MALHDPGHDPSPLRGAASPLPESIRRGVAQMPERTPGTARRPAPDIFSTARIYTTFRITLATHFPEDLGDQGFDLLVDILMYEWLARRVGTLHNMPFGIARTAAESPRIAAVHGAGLITLQPDPDRDDLLVVTLTPGARARLNQFFDQMAHYISAL